MSESSRIASLVLLSCIVCAGNASAQTTADDLTRIEAETTLLKATAKKVEVQAQIATKQAEIERLTRPAGGPGAALAGGYGDPTVQSVESIGRTRYATLNFGNGLLLDVKVGDHLPNGMKVLSINANEVMVGSGKKTRIRLAPTGQAPAFNPGYTGGTSLPLPVPGIGKSSANGIAR